MKIIIITKMPAMPVLTVVQQWIKETGMLQPKTLEDLLRCKDLYIQRASILN